MGFRNHLFLLSQTLNPSIQQGDRNMLMCVIVIKMHLSKCSTEVAAGSYPASDAAREDGSLPDSCRLSDCALKCKTAKSLNLNWLKFQRQHKVIALLISGADRRHTVWHSAAHTHTWHTSHIRWSGEVCLAAIPWSSGCHSAAGGVTE